MRDLADSLDDDTGSGRTDETFVRRRESEHNEVTQCQLVTIDETPEPCARLGIGLTEHSDSSWGPYLLPLYGVCKIRMQDYARYCKVHEQFISRVLSSHEVREIGVDEHFHEGLVVEEGDVRGASDGGVELREDFVLGRVAKMDLDVHEIDLGERPE